MINIRKLYEKYNSCLEQLVAKAKKNKLSIHVPYIFLLMLIIMIAKPLGLSSRLDTSYWPSIVKFLLQFLSLIHI